MNLEGKITDQQSRTFWHNIKTCIVYEIITYSFLCFLFSVVFLYDLTAELELYKIKESVIFWTSYSLFGKCTSVEYHLRLNIESLFLITSCTGEQLSKLIKKSSDAVNSQCYMCLRAFFFVREICIAKSFANDCSHGRHCPDILWATKNAKELFKLKKRTLRIFTIFIHSVLHD